MSTYVRLLGTPAIKWQDEWLEPPTGKISALLYYLAYQGGWVSREKLSYIFWPDIPETNARSNLRKILSRTKNLDYVVDLESERTRLRWNICTDVKDFKYAIDAKNLLTATQIYTGEFLQGARLDDSPEFESWLETTREDLNNVWHKTAFSLAAQLEANKSYEEAAEVLLPLRKADPFAEEVLRYELRYLYWAEQRSKALQTFESFQKFLKDELDGEPEAETIELVESIKQKSLELPATTSMVAQAIIDTSRVIEGSFVARQQELDQLNDFLKVALSGKRQLIFITGEAGLGKTALVNTFLAQIKEKANLRIAFGQCLERSSQGEAYMPVLEALGHLCEEADGKEVIALLAKRAPSWLVQMPWLITDEEFETLQNKVLGSTRERMLREMVETLEHLTASKPLVLMLEDLHWSDNSTLDLLTYLAQRQKPAHLLIIATYRLGEMQLPDHPLQGMKQRLSICGHCAELTLPLFAEVDVSDYLAKRFPEAKLSTEFAELVHKRTGGHPLFLRSVVDTWLAQGAELDDKEKFAELLQEIPENVRQLIEHLYNQLDSVGQNILEAASVVGLEFAAATVAATIDVKEEDIENHCIKLAKLGSFLQETTTAEWPDGTVSTRFKFQHQLYQEILYKQIPAGRQARMHRNIGERLEAGWAKLATQKAAELAGHFICGRDHLKAIEYLQLAARQDIQRSAYKEAINHLTKALNLLKKVNVADNKKLELSILAALGPPLSATKGWANPEVENLYKRANELCKSLGDPPQVAFIWFGLATMYESQGDFSKAQKMMEKRLDLPYDWHDGEILLESIDLLACSTFHQASFNTALKHAEQGLSLYDPKHHRKIMASYGENPGVGCYGWASLALWCLGYPDQALQRAFDGLKQAEEPNHLYSLASAQTHVAWLYQLRLEKKSTEEWAETAINIAAGNGFPYRLAKGTIFKGWASVMINQQEDGLDLMQEGLAACRNVGAELDRPYYLALLAEASNQFGYVDQGLEALTEALEIIQSCQDYFYKAEVLRLKGDLLLKAGGQQAANEAEENFQQALKVAKDQEARMLELRAAMSLGKFWQKQGKTAEAHSMINGVYSWFTEGFDTDDLLGARAFLDELSSEVGQTQLVTL